MIDLRRFADDPTDSLSRVLVCAAAGDRPGAAARQRAAAALGLSLAAAAGSAHAAGATTAVSGKILGAGLTKWLALGAVALAVGGFAISQAVGPRAQTAPAAPAGVVAREPARPPDAAVSNAASPPLTAPVVAAIEPPQTPRRVATVRRTPASEPAAAPPRAASTDSLAAEVALMNEAQTAVNRQAYGIALSLLADYRARFPDGVLAREARALEARARELSQPR